HGDGGRGECGAGAGRDWEPERGRADVAELHDVCDRRGTTGEHARLVANCWDDELWLGYLLHGAGWRVDRRYEWCAYMDADGGAGSGHVSVQGEGGRQRSSPTRRSSDLHGDGGRGECGAGAGCDHG